MTKPRPAPMRPEWAAYWSDSKSPHPDAGRAQNRGSRVLAPFAKDRQAHYCHHYRQVGEHYHSSMHELEACER